VRERESEREGEIVKSWVMPCMQCKEGEGGRE